MSISPPSRRFILGGGLAAGLAPDLRRPARAQAASDLIWGVNGHPITAYPGVPLAAQLDLVKSLGLTQYRINTRSDGSPDMIAELLALARERGITILPVLEPDVDLDRDSAATIRSRAFELGRAMAERFRGQAPVWELGNELENYAIIRPCEKADDGKKYPCEWGPAGGVGPLEYYGPRWAKVSAVLDGLSKGVAAGDPKARRAMGTAGWGHLGAFARMKRDGVAWDITVWHDYPGVTKPYLATLASYAKPIWITEFNAASGGAAPPEENAAKLTERIAYYRSVRVRYGVEAAFVYELLDEPYWGDDFEARMGLVSLEPDGELWRIGAEKPAGRAVRAALQSR